MAALYGRLQGSRQEDTRTGHDEIHSRLETWEGSMETQLHAEGSFRVYVGEKYSPRHLIAEGNVNDYVGAVA
jgi:hypothetical protein